MKSNHFDNCKLNPNYIDKRKEYKCPWCDIKIKSASNMIRYHFDNCKN